MLAKGEHECNDVSAKKPVWYYNNKGIRRRKINQLIRNSLSTEYEKDLSTDENHMKKLLDLFISYDFTKKEIQKMLYNKPRVLQVSKNKLQNRFRSFIRLGIPKDVVKEMVMECPSLLLLDDQITIQSRLNNLQGLPLFPRLDQNKSIYLAQKAPQLLLFSERAELYAKVKNLLQLGFNQQQLYELVMKHPALLTYSSDAVSQKINYVTEKMEGRLALFTKFPRVFSASLQRIKERHLFLVEEGYMRKTTYISENKLRSIVLTTDNDFVYRVTKTKMKDFREFQKLVRTNAIDDNEEEKSENFGDVETYHDTEDESVNEETDVVI